MRGDRQAIPPLLYVAPGVVALAMVVPLGYLVVRAFEADAATLVELLWRRRTWVLLRNTLGLTGGVVALSTLIALPLAWLTVRTDLPARRLVTLLAVTPLAIPGYVMAHALLGLGGTNGMAAAIGITMQRPSGFWGATIALSLYAYPYVFLNVRASLLTLDPGLEESARSLGYSPANVFARVVLPMLMPGLIAGWLIVALYALGDFGAVALMRFEVFSFAIYTQYAGAFDRVYASALALVLVLLAIGPLVLETRLLGSVRFARTGSGVARRQRVARLGAMKPVAIVFVAAVIAASVGLPAVSLLYWMGLSSPWGELPRLIAYFGNSVAASAPAALLAVVAAIPLAYLRVRYPGKRSILAERTAYLGYAIPPLALALGMVFFSIRVVPFLYQTLLLLVVAYAMNFLALALGPIRSQLLLAPRRLEEAARSLGRSPFEAFVTAILPVLQRGILASLTLVFVMAMKELPIAFLLAPTGFTTLSVAVFSRTSEAMFAEAAPYAAAIVVFSALFVGLMLRYEGQEINEAS